MANHYDRILKEIFEQILRGDTEVFSAYRAENLQRLDTRLTGTYERELDNLYTVNPGTAHAFLVHFEFQSANDPAMLARMQLYHSLLYKRYQLPVRHVVIYLGAPPARMPAELPPQMVFQGFELVSLREFPLAQFLGSELPEEVVLGIFGDFGQVNEKEGLVKILERLQKLGISENQLRKSLAQLGKLSRLRKLNGELKEVIEKMPIVYPYNIEEDAFFIEGEARGFEKGEEVGKKKGEQIGQFKSALLLMENGYSLEEAATMLKLDPQALESYIQRTQSKG